MISAFASSHEGFSTDLLLADPKRNATFARACEDLGLPGTASVWNRLLLRLRKRPDCPLAPTVNQFAVSFADCEPFLFASEIAWKMLIDEDRAGTLDDILCDPHLASQFDEIAGRFAPGFSALQYRWGALRIRKYAKTAKAEAEVLREAAPKKLGKRLRPVAETLIDFPAESGIYIISNHESEPVYVGGAISIRTRLEQFLRHPVFQSAELDGATIQYHRTGHEQRELLGWTSCFVSLAKSLPKFNVPDLRSIG